MLLYVLQCSKADVGGVPLAAGGLVKSLVAVLNAWVVHCDHAWCAWLLAGASCGADRLLRRHMHNV